MKRMVPLLCSFCWFALFPVSALQFSSDVPLVQPEQLNPQFWQMKVGTGDRILLTAPQIVQRNQHTFAVQDELQALQSLPDTLGKDEISQIISGVSKVPATARFYADGTAVSAAQWHAYQQMLATEQLQQRNPVKFALVVKRTALRAFPTDDRVFNAEGNQDLDRFAETALFPADAVAVLHQSADKQWQLVRSFNYTGWVKAADIAIGLKQQVLEFATLQPFIVVTGATVRTVYNPEVADVSELQLDMGVRLPLLNRADVGFSVHGQNPLASHIVKLPLRNADGSLGFTLALLPLSADVTLGYLPFNANNIIKQAFKFLGERYGWGHDYNGRDCTGFISEIFRSFGLVMPRNSGQQGKGEYGRNIRFDNQTSKAEKIQAINQAQVGDLLYFPGHVSLFLGLEQDQPFMIHDVNTLIYAKPDGEIYRGTLNGVVVTPLLPLNANAEQSYLDVLYAIKSLR